MHLHLESLLLSSTYYGGGGGVGCCFQWQHWCINLDNLVASVTVHDNVLQLSRMPFNRIGR